MWLVGVLAFGYGPPAVDGQDLACDEARSVTEEEDDRGVRIGRLARSPAVERLLRRDVLEDLRVLVRAGCHRSLDESGGDNVETDVVGRVVRRRRAGEPDDAGLCGGVRVCREVARRRGERQRTPHVDDTAGDPRGEELASRRAIGVED